MKLDEPDAAVKYAGPSRLGAGGRWLETVGASQVTTCCCHFYETIVVRCEDVGIASVRAINQAGEFPLHPIRIEALARFDKEAVKVTAELIGERNLLNEVARALP